MCSGWFIIALLPNPINISLHTVPKKDSPNNIPLNLPRTFMDVLSSWHPGYDDKKKGPLLTWNNQVSNRVGVGRPPKNCKNGLAMGVTNGGSAAKSDKNTHLWAIAESLSHNLTNRTRFEKR